MGFVTLVSSKCRNWHDIFLILAVVDCGNLTDPLNGQVNTSGTTFRQTATYSCNTGYNLVGDSTRTCQATGEWSGSAPSCQGVLLMSNLILILCAFFGASLSEPHISGTALCRCVYLRPYTINFKCAFKYFSKIERPRALVWQCWATAGVQRWQPYRRRLKFKDACPFLVCHSSYGPTITAGCSPTVQNYTWWVEVSKGRA